MPNIKLFLYSYVIYTNIYIENKKQTLSRKFDKGWSWTEKFKISAICKPLPLKFVSQTNKGKYGHSTISV